MSTKLYERFISDLELKGYAKRSIDSYAKSVHQLQRFCNKPLSLITENDLREYWLACKRDYGWSEATLRISYSGIKHFFTTTLVRKWKLLDEVEFKRKRSLPTVLSPGEIKRIICNMPTLQSSVFYITLFSLGLRLKEATHLRPGDIDGERRVVHVRNSKGAKDRVLPLPEVTLRGLRAYYKTHKNPDWVFPALGQNMGRDSATAKKPVSDNGVQGVLRRTVRKLGIKKHVHPHVFRHSYATLLIEVNVPILHVQKLMGHTNINSTMVYLHVTTRAQSHSHQIVCNIINGVFPSTKRPGDSS
jgi:site-specific recombinase XerD